MFKYDTRNLLFVNTLLANYKVIYSVPENAIRYLYLHIFTVYIINNKIAREN